MQYENENIKTMDITKICKTSSTANKKQDLWTNQSTMAISPQEIKLTKTFVKGRNYFS